MFFVLGCIELLTNWCSMTASNAVRPRVMVDMSATLIHHGHIRLLKKAAEIGDVIVVLKKSRKRRATRRN